MPGDEGEADPVAVAAPAAPKTIPAPKAATTFAASTRTRCGKETR